MHFWKEPALCWKLAICRILKGWIDLQPTILVKIGDSPSVPVFPASRVMLPGSCLFGEQAVEKNPYVCALNSKPLSGFNELSGEYSACIMHYLSIPPPTWLNTKNLKQPTHKWDGNRQILSIVQIYRCGNIKP